MNQALWIMNKGDLIRAMYLLLIIAIQDIFFPFNDPFIPYIGVELGWPNGVEHLLARCPFLCLCRICSSYFLFVPRERHIYCYLRSNTQPPDCEVSTSLLDHHATYPRHIWCAVKWMLSMWLQMLTLIAISCFLSFSPCFFNYRIKWIGFAA